MKIISSLESEVRSYCRAFPATFESARGAYLYDADGNEYLDFLCGAGSLNYGHNHPLIKEKLIEYLNDNGIVHGLDLTSSAKEDFLIAFQNKILKPRNLSYKIQFTGPTGTNAVEAAMKLARKITKRNNIISFTNGFHGVTLGAVAATGNSLHRGGASVPLSGVTFMPYDGFLGKKINTIDYVRRFLEDNSSGIDTPAAFIVETIQGEGGINVARKEWLRGLASLCKEFEIPLIVDDIQAGCGRTGSFFSFEESEIEPDMVVLSKSLSGFGLPFSVLLLKPEIDKWKPGEHNGTFRGNNLAFVTAKEAIDQFWSTQEFEAEINKKSQLFQSGLQSVLDKFSSLNLELRGRGLIWGIDCKFTEIADKISKKAFEKGLILETCGPEGQVVKFMPPLVVENKDLAKAIGIFEESLSELVDEGNYPELEKEIIQQ